MATFTYQPEYFDAITAGSLRSARATLPLVLEAVAPRSVLDVGCGTGAWLCAAGDLGVTDLQGLDGDYVDRSRLLIPPDSFRAVELEAPFELGRRFDLAMTLEVAEHLPPASADGFVSSLAAHADVVLFSAAIPRQGGENHVNEQWPEYWAALFDRHGYVAADYLRPRVWHNGDVELWYAQNMLLFVRGDRLRDFPPLAEAARQPGAPLSLVHPKLYDIYRPWSGDGFDNPFTRPAASVADADAHSLAVDAHERGDSRAALDHIRAATAELNPEVLNDLAVIGLSELGPAAARSVLRTATILAPRDAAAQSNLEWASEAKANGLFGALLREVMLASWGPEVHDNVDFVRYPDGQPPQPLHEAPDKLAAILSRVDEFERLWRKLDPASAELMVKLFAYRVLGHTKVQLPLTAARVRELTEQAYSDLCLERGTMPIDFLDWQADLYDLSPIGFPVRLHSHVCLITHTFQLQQYRWPGPPEVVGRPGDVVIDGGGCWADTALYFAHLVGPSGRVHCFEFDPANLRVLRLNLELNRELAERVDLQLHPLWSSSGHPIAFETYGPGAKVGSGTHTVETRSLDGMVRSGELDRVDFIKLDIEGAELSALEGATETMRRFRPRLAIAAYHKPDDLITIPALIDDLGVGYKFALGHFTPHSEETILFAWCDE